MKRKNTVLALLLATSLLAATFAGCGGSGGTSTTDQGGSAPASQAEGGDDGYTGGLDPLADTFPVVDEPVTLKALALAARVEVEDWSTNAVTQYWEEKTGVKLEWETITDHSAAKQKLSVVMASGQMPDIIFNASNILTEDQAVAYGAQGLILPLNGYIERYGVNTQKLFAFESDMERSMTAPDGNIYYLPSYTSNALAHTSSMQRAMVNMTWLERLGLDVPTTTDEFYDMLVAFRDEDANGNGDASDEIPLVTASINSNYTGIDTFLMNAFQFNSSKLYNRLTVEDGGTVQAAYVQDGWREGLRYLRGLYAENLIDKEVFLAQTDTLKMYTGDPGGNRVGAALMYSFSSFINLTSDVINEFDFIEPLIGPDGTQQSPYIPYWLTPSFVITNSCQYPDVAFRLGDAMIVDALADESLDAMNGIYGPEGQGWERAAEGEVGLDGTTPAVYKWLFTFGQPNNLNWHEYGIATRRDDWKLLMTAPQNEWNQEALLYQAVMEKYKPYALNKAVPSTLMFEPDKVAEVSELKETINSYVEESISKFVTGTLNVDSDWDAYVAELNAMGLDRYLELYQEAYTRQYGN